MAYLPLDAYDLETSLLQKLLVLRLAKDISFIQLYT